MMKLRALATLTTALAVTACNLAPPYQRPAATIPTAFKEAPGWQPAAPADAIAKGEWWRLFGDAALDTLEARVAGNNQNVAAAAAAYDRARAIVREARAAYLPTVDLSAGATRAGSFGNGTTTIVGGNNVSSSNNGNRRYSVSIGASWEPDLWGRVRNSVGQQRALAQASEADLANATLAAQGELALDYVQLRGIDQQKRILDQTVAAYARALTITTNRYNQGVVARVDVLQAQTQLESARANAADLGRQRAIFEHAIAVLIGANPSTFALPAAPWAPKVPDVPGLLPSELLERRPDVAAAERRVAAANAAIGVERAAFFPSIGLSGDIGTQSSRLGSLFGAASSIWSLGLTGGLTLLDFGARSARVAQARASYEQTAAEYRQTVLVAFQQVEDQLAAGRILAEVAVRRSSAAVAANRVEALTQNQYLAGLIAYSDVIVAQATALQARETEAAAQVDRQAAAISLIQAIGGSWTGGMPASRP